MIWMIERFWFWWRLPTWVKKQSDVIITHWKWEEKKLIFYWSLYNQKNFEVIVNLYFIAISCVCNNLFIVRADLLLGRDFYLAAKRAEISDFEFYCIFEQIGARAEWSQARHLGHMTLGCVKWLLETGVLGGLKRKRSAPLGRGTAEEPCHLGSLSSQVAWPDWRSCQLFTFAGGTVYCVDLWKVH